MQGAVAPWAGTENALAMFLHCVPMQQISSRSVGKPWYWAIWTTTGTSTPNKAASNKYRALTVWLPPLSLVGVLLDQCADHPTRFESPEASPCPGVSITTQDDHLLTAALVAEGT